MLERALVGLATFVVVALGSTLAGAPAQAAGSTPPAPTKNDEPTAGVMAPKGRPGASAAFSAFAAGGPYFYYNWGRQGFTGTLPTGTQATVKIASPYLDTARDYHTLAEITSQKMVGGMRQIIEAGWNVDPTVNDGSTTPHIFVSAWVNDVFQGYNGGGWVDYAPNTQDAGADISGDVGTSKLFTITYSDGNWWVKYNSAWLGYFPGTMWTGATPAVSTFTDEDFGQMFGEVAAGTPNDGSPRKPCTDMGTGDQGSSYPGPPLPATIGSASFVGLPTAEVSLSVGSTTGMSWYTTTAASARTFAYGGYGANSAGTAVGTKGRC